MQLKDWEAYCFPQESPGGRRLPIRLDGSCPVALYGAGYGGLMFLELLRSRGVEPVCLLDSAPHKQGRTIMGVPVYRPDRVHVESAVVVVCLLSMGEAYRQIRARMIELGCRGVCHLYELREDRALFEKQPLLISPDRDLLWANRERLYQVSRLLEDSWSRRVLAGILRFLWGSLDEPIPSLPMEEQYFAEDVYRLREDEIFVDCGAHTGEIMRQFFRRCQGRFAAYWAFEPDGQNCARIEEACPEAYRRQVQIRRVALGDQPCVIRVRNYDGNNSVIREDGEAEAPCAPLDSFALHPTLLKIDVEGWESRLLWGAKRTICQDRPVVAIAVYHRERDFWELPLLLKEWVPEYRFYLRSYLNVAETVLYAIPPGRERKGQIG